MNACQKMASSDGQKITGYKITRIYSFELIDFHSIASSGSILKRRMTFLVVVGGGVYQERVG